MGKVIPVTFKQNELYLYDEVIKHSSHAGFIKECIKKCLDEPQKELKKPPHNGGSECSEFNSLLNSL